MLPDHPQPSGAGQLHRPGERLTIGFLFDVFGRYLTKLWHGVAEACQQYHLNLICFAGRSSGQRLEPENPRLAVYDRASTERVEGLIIASGGNVCHGNPLFRQVHTFLQRFRVRH